MTEENTMRQTRCDACERTKENPVAIAGHYDSGWRTIAGKDLCMVCSGMLSHRMVDFLQENGELDDLVQKHIEATTLSHPAMMNIKLC